jgi:hypothetical protein
MIALVLVLAILGVLVYLVETALPMAEPFRIAIRLIVILAVVLYLVRLFGLDLALPRP